MTTSPAADFAKSFAELFNDYHDHPMKYSLQFQEKTSGQVKISLLLPTLEANVTKSLVAREILTPPLPGCDRPSWGFRRPTKRELPASYIISNLFRKILGISCQETSEITTLYRALSAAPDSLKGDAARALAQNVIFYRVVDLMQKAHTPAAYTEFCSIETRQCHFYNDRQVICCPNEKIAPWLWTIHQFQADTTTPPSPQEMPQRIAEGTDHRSFILRALACGMNRELFSPIRDFLKMVLPLKGRQHWSYDWSYDIYLNQHPIVVQNIVSSVRDDESPSSILSIVWKLSIIFDSRMCPQMVRCSLTKADGIAPETVDTITDLCSGEWERSFLGNIEALFHRPSVKEIMKSMIEQAKRFEHIVDGTLLIPTQPFHLPVSLNLDFLLQFFNVDPDIRGNFFLLPTVEPYLCGDTVPPRLFGLLIAVSLPPFEAVRNYIEHTYLTEALTWTHDPLSIQIITKGFQETVVHTGLSTCSDEGREKGSLSWKLEINLSPSGYPVSISFTSDVRGDVAPIPGSFLYCFLPPPYPIIQHEPEPDKPTAVTYIPRPSRGIVFNGSIHGEIGDEVAGNILTMLVHEMRKFSVPEEVTASPKALRQWISSDMTQSAHLMRALIAGFSSIPMFSVAEFLRRVRPVKPGETWKHEDVNSEIHVLDQGKTVQLHRVICSQCVYTYFDLLRKEQRRSLVEVQWKLELEYDEIGHPRSAKAFALSQNGLESIPSIGKTQKFFDCAWFAPSGYRIENIFRSPPTLRERAFELSKMQTPLIVSDDSRSLIRISEEGMELVTHDDRSGLELLLERLGFPREMQILSRSQKAFQRRLEEYIHNRSTWEAFVKFLKLPENFSYTDDNRKPFLDALRPHIEEHKRRLHYTRPRNASFSKMTKSFSVVDFSKVKGKEPETVTERKPVPSDEAPSTQPSRPHEDSCSSTWMSKSTSVTEFPHEMSPREPDQDASFQRLTKSFSMMTLDPVTVESGGPIVRGHECPAFLQGDGAFSPQPSDDSNREQRIWNMLLGEFGINIDVEVNDQVVMKQFEERWGSQDEEDRGMNFLFLLGLIGWEGVQASLTDLLNRESCLPCLEGGIRWKHIPGHIDVNFGKNGGCEITRQGRSSQRLSREVGTEIERAAIGWSLTMRFDQNMRLVETISSVHEICAPSLTPEDVKKVLLALCSKWDCQQDEETVCPFISIPLKEYQEKYPSARHNFVRIPSTLASFAIDKGTRSFVRHATGPSLDLRKINPILVSVAKSVVSQHIAQNKDSKDTVVSWCHVIQTSLSIAASGEAKQCHSITTFLYSIYQGPISHFHKHAMIPWKIEFLLEASGEPRSVSVDSEDKILMEETLGKACEETLRTIWPSASTRRSIGASLVQDL